MEPNNLMVVSTFTTFTGIQEEMKGMSDDGTAQSTKQLLIGPIPMCTFASIGEETKTVMMRSPDG